jgi:hypothetical protein
MSQGKGISDAVRESISTWITTDVASKIQIASGSPGSIQGYQLRDAKGWVRRVRRSIAGGWERDYDCKQVPGGRVGLRVHTDSADEYIKYVTFRVDGKLIGGGVVNVPSMNLDNRFNRNARIQNPTFTSSEAKPKFRPFTADELHRLSTTLEFGGASMDSMFEDRV